MVRHQNVDDPYIVLNLVNRDTSTPEEIKQSYRQLAKKYHPDTWSASCFSETEKQHATTKFQQISAANTVLTDPIQKSIYDRNYKLGLYDNDNDNDTDNDNTNNGSSGNGNGRNNNRSTTDRRQSSSNNSQRQQEQYSQQSQSQQSHQSQSQIPKRPMGIPPPLPKGWTTITDPISGNLYYYHKRSQRSTWNHPALCSNTSSYNNNTAAQAQAQQRTRTSSGNTNYNFGSSGKQQKNYPPNKNKMFGGDFPFNRRPYNNDRYNANTNTNTNSYYNNMDDENINAGGRKVIVDKEPDTHRCGSFLVLLLCPPIGILAMYHSIMVTRCWDKSQEQDSNNDIEEEDKNNDGYDENSSSKRQRQEELAQGHSTRAGLYACFGNSLGILFWIYYLFVRGGDESIFEFPKEWNIEECPLFGQDVVL
ncbi:DnaJ-domain-containing protein [Fragilariopsis cylindrus CCMP1102]|uniref:DnaJ-domain-containing protein n=1 Tax=Fragilariopsis cylindrus CCMP1102 TaxID=635003 RepID=A0A1E7EZJ1_9STRA|nr:DnaJ-domain-containing protein [Fragilariopsis cylindrus CCMP1102]|eukprot:OEU11244.1 DnaJ-domain-containing protein [Fragilariopsis cylindrus CCMP1102]